MAKSRPIIIEQSFLILAPADSLELWLNWFNFYD